jgi:GNAT superfamily N-acetyltransferase
MFGDQHAAKGVRRVAHRSRNFEFRGAIDPEREGDGVVIRWAKMMLGAIDSLPASAFPATVYRQAELSLFDLSTSPGARGSGVPSAPLERAAEVAAEDGAHIVSWITTTDNSQARGLSDSSIPLTSGTTEAPKVVRRSFARRRTDGRPYLGHLFPAITTYKCFCRA